MAPTSRPSPLSKEVLMTTTSMLPDIGIELREGYAEVGDVNLHYVEAGDGCCVSRQAGVDSRSNPYPRRSS